MLSPVVVNTLHDFAGDSDKASATMDGAITLVGLPLRLRRETWLQRVDGSPTQCTLQLLSTPLKWLRLGQG